MLFPTVHYIVDDVVVHRQSDIDLICLQNIQEEPTHVNSGKTVKEVHMHFSGENFHQHLKKSILDDDVRAMEHKICEQKVSEVQL